MKTFLTVICSLTLLATVYLSLSLVILHPPRANYQQWFPRAALFLAQGVLTVIAIARGVSGRWFRRVLAAGAIAIILEGGSWVYATLHSPHFEGYALVLGSLLVIQGALTVHVLTSPAGGSVWI